ncbi:hypothetical protein L9F63_017977, partial [Diploptera punctata]
IPPGVIYGGIIIVTAVVVPTIVYLTVFSDNPEFQSEIWTCALRPSYRVPCLKGFAEVNENYCTTMGCCWNNTDQVCFHSNPSQLSYSVDGWVDKNTARDQLCSSFLDLTSRQSKSPYGRDIATQLRAAAVPVTESHLQIFIYNKTAGEPDFPERIAFSDTTFQVSIYGPDYLSIEISRKEDENSYLLSTSNGPLIGSNNYWELTIQFQKDSKVFGLGEIELISKPKVLFNNENRTGANPFIMVLNNDGKAHGILFNNPGPIEFELLENSNLLIVRSLSTAHWDFSVFAGPTPKDVMKQFTENRRPIVPPQWALGFHICRDTKENTTIDYIDAFLQSSINLSLPYESDCVQESLMGSLNFTLSETMEMAVDNLRNSGKKILISLQPQVESSMVDNDELFVLNETGQVFVNDYKNKSVSLLDFFNNKTGSWLQDNLKTLQVEDFLGGYVLQEDWPAVNTTPCHDSEAMGMDYVPGGSLSNGTLCWTTRHGEIHHYLIHNEYGLKFASSLDVSKDKIVLSTSTYTGSGTVGGSHAHVQNKVTCTWDNMATALKVVLGLGLSGIPFSGGGPICGNTGNYDEELCLRWYLMSSMLPLMRVSSSLPLRDPANIAKFNSPIADAIQRRYSLISYFHSLFLEANMTGVPVARPMFFEFPADNKNWDRYDHFMVGSALLVRPMFLPSQVSVQVYLPKEDIPWYHLRGGHKLNNGSGGYEISVSSLPTDLVILVRGGYIIPLQEEVQLSVSDTISTPYTLIVGLNCSEDGSCRASGDLRSEDYSLNFTSTESTLNIEANCYTQVSPVLDSILVYGLEATSGKSLDFEITPQDCVHGNKTAEIIEQDYVLKFTFLSVDLCCGQIFINWAIS